VDWRTCEYGDTTDPTATVALVGDSHAAALVPAFDAYFAEQGWRVVTYLRVGCPAATTKKIVVPGRTEAALDECTDWSARVLDEVESRDDIDSVVFTNFSQIYFSDVPPPSERLVAEDIAGAWATLPRAGKQVVFVRDVPSTSYVNIPACLAKSVNAEEPCSFDRATGIRPSEFLRATTLGATVPLVDMTDYFCDDDTCYSVVGDVVVYADSNHISGTYAKTLAPFLGDRIMAALEQ
jgi:hypothetical protein